ncbi:MAG: c-type cytochrome biogenesis protein CcmI [Alphaproteobacteria bacterium]|nr:c-type cytochrome biogenesis protein CcmI [Alphaproteobacteria bacterium]
MIWVIFAVLTAAVIAVLLWPVARSTAPSNTEDRESYDRAIFRDQLAELDRDVERGMIGAAEADAARNEIARRIIAADAQQPAKQRIGGAWLALVAALLLPAAALPLYLSSGSPNMPDVPRAERMAKAAETGDFEAMIAQVEEHLAKNPDDLAGWKVIGPAYRRAERWSDLAEAQRNILRLSQPSAEMLSDYGEALVLANRGLVSAEARKLFGEALVMDPRMPKARYFQALALKQEGKTEEAKAAFNAFLQESPADAPWRPMLMAEIKDLSGGGSRPPALDQSTMEQAANMSSQDRQAMIRSMVDGLEEKLKTDGKDLDGWLRLIRARTVLGETEKAKTAYTTARDHFKDDPQALAQLEGLAQEMNIP